ncbi:MAG: YggT family protein [Candidatus Omnitrophica bacterium]|nr:YggT family protein [Candidatus Omnitrophota bacterium]
MFAVSNLLVALARILDVVFNVLWWLILIRALISWVSPNPYNPVVQFLYKTTEPILYPIRKILPRQLKLGIDLSPLVAFLIIMFLRSFLIQTLLDLSVRLQ